ncbi:hypothetical protein [Nocardioides sp.]|uniref:hypothetical protein n=1 Tax=Nocardioides sp. TaxID=35761 RepID=UPI00351228CE
MGGPVRTAVSRAAAWAVAATLAVVTGLAVVAQVGASVRARGALTADEDAVRQVQAARAGQVRVDPDAPRTARDFSGAYGRFRVVCAGAAAIGETAVAAADWRVVSYEPGPDDDVDAVFASGRRSVELEVFCLDGVPTVSDREVKTLPSGTRRAG